jgi:2-polyprenyl-3-methyl-5-hydroxy-6-metoxy-1,4-benzoquinol methylase
MSATSRVERLDADANYIRDRPEDYRRRIYHSYVATRPQSLTARSVKSFRPEAQGLRRMIRHHFPRDRDAAILELGCGHGILMHFAQEAGYRNVIGVDASPEQVATAHALGIAGAREGDLFATLNSAAPESYDVVLAYDVLEHFRKDELMVFADEVHRILRPGGKWIVRVPNADAPFAMRMRYGDFTHELIFNRDSLGQLLQAVGFKQVDSFEAGIIPNNLRTAVRWTVWQGVRLCLRLVLFAETGGIGRGLLFSQNFIAIAIK